MVQLGALFHADGLAAMRARTAASAARPPVTATVGTAGAAAVPAVSAATAGIAIATAGGTSRQAGRKAGRKAGRQARSMPRERENGCKLFQRRREVAASSSRRAATLLPACQHRGQGFVPCQQPRIRRRCGQLADRAAAVDGAPGAPGGHPARVARRTVRACACMAARLRPWADAAQRGIERPGR